MITPIFKRKLKRLSKQLTSQLKTAKTQSQEEMKHFLPSKNIKIEFPTLEKVLQKTWAINQKEAQVK